MAQVVFSDSKAFLEELATERRKVDLNIVRVTFLFRTSSQTPHIEHVTLEAGYTIDGHVAKLVKDMGNLWRGAPGEDEAAEERNQLKEQLENDLRALGFEVRGGWLEGGK